MTFPSTEVRIIATFKQGLKQAVSDYNGLSWDDVDSITEQKLLLMGLRGFGLEDEVTIQWYADGDMLPELDDGIENPEELAIRNVDGGPYPAVREVAAYYNPEEGEQSELADREETMPEIVHADTFDWLRDYYQQREGPFQELYLKNMDIHLHNYRCMNACDPEQDVEFPDDLVQPLLTAIEEMKRELLRYPIFNGLEPYVTEFSRVAESVMEWCEENNIKDLDQEELEEYKRLFSHLNTFYYHGLWRQVTRLIAVYTIDGPEAYFERAAEWGRIDKTREKFIEVFENFRDTAEDYDIEVSIHRDRIPEVWIKEEGFSEDDLLNWDMENSLSKEEISTIPDDDPAADLVS